MRYPHPLLVTALLVAGFFAWKNGPALLRSGSPALAANTVSKDGMAAKTAAAASAHHVYDEAHVLPLQDVPRFEQYMNWIARESDVDLRLVFVAGTHGRTIEQLATEKFDELRIGGRTRDARGVLLLYDMQGQQLRIEVGYGLEAWFPDAFVSYLIHDHARMFFASQDLSTGLRLMLRLLQHRIREAVLGNDFDPRVIGRIERRQGPLSGGAGAGLSLGRADRAEAVAPHDADAVEFAAQTTPAATYATYLRWLGRKDRNADADFLTPESRQYVAGLPLSRAYTDFIYFAEDGKRFEVIEEGDLAALVFTGTPFVSPHLFLRRDGVWRMDIVAEVRDTHEHVGGVYTWSFSGQNDGYSRAFASRLVELKGYRRFRTGDNRPLRIRGD